VTVLKHYPVSANDSSFNKFVGLFTLTLTKGDGCKSFAVALLLGKFEERRSRIGTSGQNEDKWSLAVSVSVDYFHSGRLGFNEEFAHVFEHIKLEGESNLFGTECLEHNQFLEVTQLLLPVKWE
jgi:hypothetical protein